MKCLPSGTTPENGETCQTGRLTRFQQQRIRYRQRKPYHDEIGDYRWVVPANPHKAQQKDVGLAAAIYLARVITSERLSTFNLEQLFNSEYYHSYIKYFASGTLVLHLNLNGINWFNAILPPVCLLNKFEEFCKPLLEKKGNPKK